MRLATTVLALAMMTGTTPLLAADAPAPEATKAAKPKMICRPLPARTGSHRPQGRICKTAEEWRIRDRDVYVQGPLEDQTKVEPVGPKI
ncbi:MAG: hypothetical protein EBR34_04160 [Sphingomonadaceae bacterium]|nr:hypothetical protein [Sphingomonadaceae bacterium]